MNRAVLALVLGALAACGGETEAPAEAVDMEAAGTDMAAGETVEPGEEAGSGAEAPDDAMQADAGATIDLPTEDMDPAARMLAESQAFLTANGEREEVTVTDSGLQYEVVNAAPPSAPSPSLENWVCVHYTGELADGTVFDSSRAGDDAAPIVLPLNGLIEGWREGLPMMAEGDRWKLYIPPAMGYGPSGAGAVIPPNAALVFDLELFRVLGAEEIAVSADGRVDPDWNCAEDS